MRTIITLILVLMFFTIIGCGKESNSGQQSSESQTAISVPKMDLHVAVFTGNLKTIYQHIKAGSDLNVLESSRKSTPLITAAALGKTEATKILIEAGADLNYKNIDGSTALCTATIFGNTEVAKILIDAGTDLNNQNNDGLNSPSHFNLLLSCNDSRGSAGKGC